MLLIATPTAIVLLCLFIIFKFMSIDRMGWFDRAPEILIIFMAAVLLSSVSVLIMIDVGRQKTPEDQPRVVRQADEVLSVEQKTDFVELSEYSTKNYENRKVYFVEFLRDGEKFDLIFDESELEIQEQRNDSPEYEVKEQCYSPNLLKLKEHCEYDRSVVYINEIDIVKSGF